MARGGQGAVPPGAFALGISSPSKVTVTPNRFWCDGDGADLPLLIAIDTDQNSDTGSAFYGTEVELAWSPAANSPVFARASGWDFKAAPFPYGGIGLECGPTIGGYFIDTAALGITPASGFNVVAATVSPHTDTAPDIGTFNCQPVAGTLPPKLGPDTRAPGCHLSRPGRSREACNPDVSDARRSRQDRRHDPHLSRQAAPEDDPQTAPRLEPIRALARLVASATHPSRRTAVLGSLYRRRREREQPQLGLAQRPLRTPLSEWPPRTAGRHVRRSSPRPCAPARGTAGTARRTAGDG